MNLFMHCKNLHDQSNVGKICVMALFQIYIHFLSLKNHDACVRLKKLPLKGKRHSRCHELKPKTTLNKKRVKRKER